MVPVSTAPRHARFSSFLLVSLLLSACGGGSGGPGTNSYSANTVSIDTAAPTAQPNTSPSPSTAPTADEPLTSAPEKEITTIEYHGDSTIWGYRSGSGDRVATTAPMAFAAALANSGRYVVRNRGVNSADACELLNGGNARYTPSWDTYLASSDADILIINHAINDQWRMTTDRYGSCLNSLASIAKRHGKKVIFETPNPTRDSYPGGLGAYADVMKSVASAQGVAVIDQHAHLMGRLNGDYRNVTSIIPDGLHPDEATYVLKGRHAADVFGRLAS